MIAAALLFTKKRNILFNSYTNPADTPVSAQANTAPNSVINRKASSRFFPFSRKIVRR